LSHKPVLLKEVLNILEIKKNGIYIDGTFGCGGHSKGILKKLGEKGKLHIFDKDMESILLAKKLQLKDPRIIVHHDSFSQIYKLEKYQKKIDGILLDLGVSSLQINSANRGFSFLKSGPLDMRMNISSGETAENLLKKIKKKKLIKILKKYGEEYKAKYIAHEILEERKKNPIQTTLQLSNIIKKSTFNKYNHKHPARKTFQALRIYINQEIKELNSCIKYIPKLLKSGGIFIVISFHSLEDRIIKTQFKNWINLTNDYPVKLPVKEEIIEKKKYFKWKIKRIKPSNIEININRRSRSAILRAIKKI